MARHYATRDFFRQMPNPLLARYFHARGVFDDLDIAALPEPQPDALWAAWLTLVRLETDNALLRSRAYRVEPHLARSFDRRTGGGMDGSASEDRRTMALKLTRRKSRCGL